MEQIEIKEYDLRFIIDRDARLRVGSNVALENIPPMSADDFYWIESIHHEPFGVMYKVYGVDTTFHACELYPLFPVLVSDDVLDYHDKFYHNGIIHECVGLNLDDDLNMWVVSNENLEIFIERDVMKVVAMPEMFGWLYNEKEIMKHVFKCPYPLAKMLDEHRGSYSPWDCAKVWKEQRKVLLNIENLKPEIYTSPYFLDTTKMASSLGKKVNCSWGLKRLKQEHDNFSKEIVKVILEFEELQQLRIKKVYRDFAAFSGIELLETNHDLIAEGKTMHHCVGTYSSTVDTGTCAIYRYKGHTLDLRFRKPYVFKTTDEELKKKLDINQFMGYDNVSAPKELRDEVQLILDAFNSKLMDYDTEDDIEWYESLNHDNDLPF